MFERWLRHVPKAVRRLGARARRHVELTLAGVHNRRNAACALAALELCGVDRSEAAAVLGEFRGAGRRFELVGEPRGIAVYDDYAHHPSEVEAAIAAAREASSGRVLAAFQPHLYSRTRHLAREFAVALAGADAACVTEIYAAREEPVEGVSGKLIVDALSEVRPGAVGRLDARARGCGFVSGRARRARRSCAHHRRGRHRPRRAPAGGGARVRIEEGVELRRLTTIGTGGPARAFARPETRRRARGGARLGSGARSSGRAGRARLEPAGGRRGLRDARAQPRRRPGGGEPSIHRLLRAGGGASLAVCLHRAREAELGRLEFACAIPGTAGGGVWMNAGAYGGDIAGVLERALVVEAGSAAVDDAGRARAAVPPLRAASGAGRGAGGAPARAAAARGDQADRRRDAGAAEGGPADEQAHVRQRVQEPRARALGGPDARGVRAARIP